MRIPVRHAGTALLVAALLLGAVAASLRFFVLSPGQSRGAVAGGLTPAASPSGPAQRNAAQAGSGSPASSASGHAQVSAGAVAPRMVTVAGPAALPSAHVHAGLDTPEDAVDGFYLALLSGTPARACAYVTSPCPSFGSRPVTGQVTVLDAVSDGAKALVEFTGSICVGMSCVPLTDRVMMPTSRASFGTSWASLMSGIYGWAAAPLPCVQDPATKQWHVRLP